MRAPGLLLLVAVVAACHSTASAFVLPPRRSPLALRPVQSPAASSSDPPHPPSLLLATKEHCTCPSCSRGGTQHCTCASCSASRGRTVLLAEGGPLGGGADGPPSRSRGSRRRRAREAWGAAGGSSSIRQRQPAATGRPKAQKPPPLTVREASSGGSNHQGGSRARGGDVGPIKTMGILMQGLHRLVNSPVENYLLLLGDVAVLLGFRLMEDMLLDTPFLSGGGGLLEAGGLEQFPLAQGVMEGAGLSMVQADEVRAEGARHAARVLSDGCGLGLCWVVSVVMGRNKALSIRASTDQRVSCLVTMKTWIGASHMRLWALLIQSLALEEVVDFHGLTLEMWGTLVLMLGWRAVYAAA